MESLRALLAAQKSFQLVVSRNEKSMPTASWPESLSEEAAMGRLLFDFNRSSHAQNAADERMQTPIEHNIDQFETQPRLNNSM